MSLWCHYSLTPNADETLIGPDADTQAIAGRITGMTIPGSDFRYGYFPTLPSQAVIDRFQMIEDFAGAKERARDLIFSLIQRGGEGGAPLSMEKRLEYELKIRAAGKPTADARLGAIKNAVISQADLHEVWELGIYAARDRAISAIDAAADSDAVDAALQQLDADLLAAGARP